MSRLENRLDLFNCSITFATDKENVDEALSDMYDILDSLRDVDITIAFWGCKDAILSNDDGEEIDSKENIGNI